MSKGVLGIMLVIASLLIISGSYGGIVVERTVDQVDNMDVAPEKSDTMDSGAVVIRGQAIKPGMSRNEVRALLGDPVFDEIEYSDSDSWIYNDDDNEYKIEFENNQVINIWE